MSGGGLVHNGCGGKLNQKIYLLLEKHLEKDGKGAVHKPLRSAKKALAKHEAKLSELQYQSAVEKTIKNVKNQVHTIEKFIKDKDL